MTKFEKPEVLIAFASGAILADGHYDEAEKSAISSIAKTFSITEQEMFSLIDSEIAKQKQMSGENLDTYLIDFAKKLNDNEKFETFQVCLVIILSDGKLSKNEMALLLGFADTFKIDVATAMLMMAYMVNKETNLTVEVEN